MPMQGTGLPVSPEEIKDHILGYLQEIRFQAEQSIEQVKNTVEKGPVNLGLGKYVSGELSFMHMKFYDLSRDIKRSFPLPPKPPKYLGPRR